MDRKQLINAVIILVILTVISFFTFKKNLSSWHRGNDIGKKKIVTNFDVNKVAKITIADSSESLTLYKNGDDKWCISERADFPANFEKLSDFLLTLSEINIIQTPRITKAQLPSLKLIMPKKGSNNKETGTTLAIYDKSGKKMLSLLIGEQHFPKQEADPTSFNRPEADGCYILKDGSDQVALINNALSAVNPDPKRWMDKDFFKIDDILAISRKDKQGKTLWTISRDTLKSPWKIAGLEAGEQPLPRPMMEATLAFSKMTFNDVYSLEGKEFKNADTIVINTERGLLYKIQLIPEGNNYIAKCTIAINPDAFTQAPDKKEGLKDKKTEEESLTAKKRLLNKELENLTKYTKWAFELPKYKVEKVLKKRNQFYRPTDI